MDYALVLSTFYSDKKWSIGESYDSLDWFDESPKPSKEELESKYQESISMQKKEFCKENAKKALLETDWSELPTAYDQLENVEEFKQYRIHIRKFIINPEENPIFPNKPEAIWIT